MTQHTQGPWDICVSNNSNLVHVEHAVTHEQIATVNKGNKEQRIANAYLIAAAPDLLAVVCEFLDCGQNAGHNEELKASAQTAIKKATGE